MPSVSNIAVGAAMAGAAASKARHQMNESIARLSTGIRSMYGGDAAGQSVANSLGARGASFAVAARNAEDGISFLQAAESVLLEMAALTTRLRELGIQYANNAILTLTDEAALNAEAQAIGDALNNVADNRQVVSDDSSSESESDTDSDSDSDSNSDSEEEPPKKAAPTKKGKSKKASA